MADLSELATAERRDLADYLDTLREPDWRQPSSCSGWTVRDVVGHVSSFDVLSWPELLALFVRSRFSLARCNQVGVANSRQLSTEQLTARLRAHAVPRGITTLFGSAIALTDTLIHHQNIRQALSQPRSMPEERVVAALKFAPRALVLPAPANMRGLRLIATDMEWSHGTGPEVTGPGAAILMTVAGRQQGLASLAGAGLPTLTQRLVGTTGA